MFNIIAWICISLVLSSLLSFIFIFVFYLIDKKPYNDFNKYFNRVFSGYWFDGNTLAAIIALPLIWVAITIGVIVGLFKIIFNKKKKGEKIKC